MRVIFTILFIIIGALAVFGQSLEHIDLDATTAEYDTLRAPNVKVGTYTVMSAYPEIEFIFYFREHKLRVTRTDDLGKSNEQVLEALVTQVTGWTYRAQVNETTFVEINAADGATFVHQRCQTRVFLPVQAAAETVSKH